jgi:hypothetical protein
VLRDAVSNFEIYLEKAREEILAHQGQPQTVADRSPTWKQLDEFFQQFGVVIQNADVGDVVALRNFLTHRRGELRTEKLRNEFQATHSDLFPPLSVELTKERVLEAMDALAAAVRTIDQTVWAYSWGRARFPNLRP